jgi:hypothetical protein
VLGEQQGDAVGTTVRAEPTNTVASSRLYVPRSASTIERPASTATPARWGKRFVMHQTRRSLFTGEQTTSRGQPVPRRTPEAGPQAAAEALRVPTTTQRVAQADGRSTAQGLFQDLINTLEAQGTSPR